MFPVELKKGIKGVSNSKKADFPQERISDSMSIAKKVFKRVWRPNNYRRQIKVKIKSDSGIEKIKTAIVETSIGKRNKLLFIPYKDVLIQYGRNTLTGIYSQKIINGEKEVFVYESPSINLIEDAIKDKKDEIMGLIDDALFSFIRKFSIGLIGAVPIWDHHEDWTIDEEIKKIPAMTMIHGAHFKKVYLEGGEFVGGKNKEPISQLINHIRNSGLEDFSPVVAEAVLLNNPLRYLKHKVKGIADVLEYPEFVRILTIEEKLDFELWLFETFGVGV